MVGETDLNKLLGAMQPKLSELEYVFVSLKEDSEISVAKLRPIGTFREDEGLTVILQKAEADTLGLAYQGTFKNITLTVHSSLEAVGLTAAVSTTLAKQGISANVVAAFYHDHVFVPSDKASQALACLVALAKASASEV